MYCVDLRNKADNAKDKYGLLMPEAIHTKRSLSI